MNNSNVLEDCVVALLRICEGLLEAGSRTLPGITATSYTDLVIAQRNTPQWASAPLDFDEFLKILYSKATLKSGGRRVFIMRCGVRGFHGHLMVQMNDEYSITKLRIIPYPFPKVRRAVFGFLERLSWKKPLNTYLALPDPQWGLLLLRYRVLGWTRCT